MVKVLAAALLLSVGLYAASAAQAQTAIGPAPTVAPVAAKLPAVAPWAVSREGVVTPEHASAQVLPSTPAPAGLYVAMGDSITYGVGIKQNCAAFPAHPVDIASFCPEGQSYAILTALALRKAGVAGHFMNLGIGGAHVERIIADELPYLPVEATLVTVYIGTNDSRVVKNLKHPIADVVQQYEEHYDQLLAMIHARAPKARIVLIDFPNEKYLAETYHFPDEVLPRFDATSQLLAQFIDGHYPKYAVVDTICNPKSYDATLLYKGGVHPNEAGAFLLAQDVVRVILADKPPAPPTHCTWYDAATAGELIHRP
ncbi:MAG: SGNH/GDSL hydrolase family protein [Acidobacteriaceae bacterium]|nr:SGNH/GDSL hydrolase family protein [Acidobacteriaceae bacterium]